jgi:hypothetical protein
LNLIEISYYGERTQLELALNITGSYQKVYEITAEKVAHALDSLEEENVPSAMQLDLLKNAHQSAYEFVDSVINVGKYTRNPELVKEIQSTFLDGAIAMYDRVFDEFYQYTKSSSRETTGSERGNVYA